MRDGVYLSRYQDAPVIKLRTKTFAILFITDISILDISHIISNLTNIIPPLLYVHIFNIIIIILTDSQKTI